MADDDDKRGGGVRDPRDPHPSGGPKLPGGGPEPKKPSAFERWRSPLIWALVVLLGLFLFQTFLQDSNVNKVPLSRFKQAIAAGTFSKVVVSQDWVKGFPKEKGAQAAGEKTGQGAAKPAAGSGGAASGEGSAPAKGPAARVPPLTSGEQQAWLASKPPDDQSIFKLLDENDVPYSYEQPSSFGSLIWIWIVPIGIALLLWSFFMRRMSAGVGGQGPQGLMAFGKTKARVHMEPDTGVSFKDVAGIDEAVEELQEIVGFLQKPEKYRRLGGKIPKGVLLVGPPGTGKTLLARAVAGEAGVPFLSLSGSEFVEMFVGVGAARVRDLFQSAQSRAPAIIFIDELDALAKARNAGGMLGGHDEREQTLNQLLSEMDGFDPKVGLIVLAATNRPEILDQALLRPGRFDRQVLVDRPDKRGRHEILEIHVREVKLSKDVDLEAVAAQTPGFAGADLANVVNEAALLAARRNADEVQMQDFDEAIERVVAGLRKKNRRMNQNEKRIVAYHESGHALVGLSLEHADPVQKVSIIPHGLGALGYTLQMPLEDRYLLRVDELRDKMAGLLGGRAAEEIVFGVVTTGASDDLKKATQIARVMVTEYGMSQEVGPLGLGGQRNRFLGDEDQPMFGEKNYSERTAELIDREVRRLVEEAADRAREVLRRRRDVLEQIAQHLLTQEVIDKDQLEAIAGPPVRPRTGPGGDGGPTDETQTEPDEARSSGNGHRGGEPRETPVKAEAGDAGPSGEGADTTKKTAGKKSTDGDTERQSA